MWRLIPAAFLLMSATSCATYHTPKGDDVAILKGAVRNLGITIVDGEATCSVVQVEGVREVKLSPGKHSVRVVAMLGGYYAEGDLWFIAKPCREYELQYHSKDMRVAFWIVDTSTGLPVGGIKGSDDEPSDVESGQEERPQSPVLQPGEI